MNDDKYKDDKLDSKNNKIESNENDDDLSIDFSGNKKILQRKKQRR